MSLNWKEIDYILSEWNLLYAKIQRVLQPNPYELFIEVYNSSNIYKNNTNNTVIVNQKNLVYLSIVLENNAVRIHTTTHGIKKPKVPQRFQQLLQSRIIGTIITEITHVNHDRILRFTLQPSSLFKEVHITPDTLHKHTLYLYVRLWSNQANIILTDANNKIIDLTFRRPKQSLMPGDTFIIPPHSTNKKEDSTQIRAGNISHTSFNQFIEQFYSKKKKESQQETLLLKIKSAVQKQNQLLSQKKIHIEAQLEQYPKYKELENYGNLILSNSTNLSKNSKSLIISYSNDNLSMKELIIPLNPALSFTENAQHYFNQARKIKNRQETILKQQRTLEEEFKMLNSIISSLTQEHCQLTEQQLKWLFPKHTIQTSTNTPTKNKKPIIKIQFQDGPYLIMVGRNLKENDILLRHYVKGNDIWLHSRGYSGAYVFIRTSQNITIPLEKLIQCGQIAALYSKAKNEIYLDVYYTEVKYLKRIKKSPGIVSPLRDKNLQIKVDNEYIKQYLSQFI